MAQMIIRRHQGKPSSVVRRQKYKNLASNPSAPPRRLKSEIPPAASPTDVSFLLPQFLLPLSQQMNTYCSLFFIYLRYTLFISLFFMTNQYDAGVAGAGVSSSESEEESAPVPLGPSAFWTAMEPYLRAPTDQDLACILDSNRRGILATHACY